MVRGCVSLKVLISKGGSMSDHQKASEETVEVFFVFYCVFFMFLVLQLEEIRDKKERSSNYNC